MFWKPCSDRRERAIGTPGPVPPDEQAVRETLPEGR